jgi:threonine aldolase
MKTLLIAALALSALTANAAVRYMADLLEKATPTDAKELKTLRKKMESVPTMKDPETNQQFFEVTEVKEGSVYERAGVKKGDIIVNGAQPNTVIPVEL